MKKRIFILISVLALICFCSCEGNDSASNLNNSGSISDVSELSAESSITVQDTANNSNASEIGDTSEICSASDDSSDEDNGESSTAGDEGDYFEISVESGVYCFYTDEMKGSYKTDFSIVQGDAPALSTLVLKDGRNIQLNYGEIVFDEEDSIYKTEINGFTFWIEEFHDSEGRLCQVLECIEKTERTIFVLFYPELDYGTVEIHFDFVADGDKYTLNYADGQTAEKTVVFDSESGEYYFG